MNPTKRGCCRCFISSILYRMTRLILRLTLSPAIVHIFLFIGFRQYSLACGPFSTAASAFSPLLGQSADSDTIQVAQFDKTVQQWAPNNFKSASDLSVLTALNRNLKTAFGRDVIAKKFDSGASTSKGITCSSELSCDFSNGGRCGWKNSKDDDAQFYIVEGTVDKERLKSYTGTRIPPESPFLVTAASSGQYEAWLVSDTVPGQPDQGSLQLRYWLTPPTEIRVCTKQADNAGSRSCSDPLHSNNDPGPATIAIPGPIKKPFNIIIEVKNFAGDSGGMAFIDDITYRSGLCGEEQSTRTELGSVAGSFTGKRKLATEQRREPALDICQAVPCSFQDENPCGYVLFGTGATLPWRVAQGPVGNRLTGIQRDARGRTSSGDGYLLASGKRQGLKDIFVAQSRPFLLDRPISIHFFRHLLSSTSQLRVCLSDLSLCPSTFKIHVDALDWQESIFDLAPSDIPKEQRDQPITLLFVAQGLKQNNYIGIDNIKVREHNGSVAC